MNPNAEMEKLNESVAGLKKIEQESVLNPNVVKSKIDDLIGKAEKGIQMYTSNRSPQVKSYIESMIFSAELQMNYFNPNIKSMHSDPKTYNYYNGLIQELNLKIQK